MKDIKKYLTESDNPFKKSKIKGIVYRCGNEALEPSKATDIIWFSDKPLDRFGKMSRYYLDIQRPLVIDVAGEGWCDKLWTWVLDEDGNPTNPTNDPKLTARAPEWIWKMARDSSDEIEWGDIPYIVYRKFRNKYDCVILKNIYETESCDIEVTDYCVFSMGQVAQA